MLLLTMIFVAGVLHGLGPDHLAAITAFGAITGHSFRRLAFFSVRFALGHAVVICGAALLAHFVRVTLPLTWERGFDLAAAALLLITGFALALGLITGRLSVHAHPHHHGGRGDPPAPAPSSEQAALQRAPGLQASFPVGFLATSGAPT